MQMLMLFFILFCTRTNTSIPVCHVSSETALTDPDLPCDAAMCCHSPLQQASLLTHCKK